MSKLCKNCLKILSKDEVALNYKIRGRNITDFLCISCLAQEYKANSEELQSLILFYKGNGCGLFK